MDSFIKTGFHQPTITTCDDPSLTVNERDNGHTWLMHFYVGDTLIDMINMERPGKIQLHPDVAKLPVLDWDNQVMGTVGERYAYAQELDKGYDEAMMRSSVVPSDINLEDYNF